MGYTQAIGMAEATDLITGVTWHLTANHFPPHPTFMVPVAIKAIELARDGDWDALVELPEGVEYRGGRTPTAGMIVEAFHLEPWIEEEEF